MFQVAETEVLRERVELLIHVQQQTGRAALECGSGSEGELEVIAMAAPIEINCDRLPLVLAAA